MASPGPVAPAAAAVEPAVALSIRPASSATTVVGPAANFAAVVGPAASPVQVV